MKPEYVNSFIKATFEIIKMAAQIELKTGKPFVQVNPFHATEVIIVVGITGEIRGQAMISIPGSMAKHIASNMMMGMPVDELDDMAKSALQELGNMIMGNAATLLYNEGVKIDITPPTLMLGSNIEISGSSLRIIGIPLTSDEGQLVLNVATED